MFLLWLRLCDRLSPNSFLTLLHRALSSFFFFNNPPPPEISPLPLPAALPTPTPRRARRAADPSQHRQHRPPLRGDRHAPPPGRTPRLLTRCPRGKARRARLLGRRGPRSEEHTSELQSRSDLVCRLLLEKKKVR